MLPKSILLVFVLILSAVTQSQTIMRIHQTNGTVLEIPISTIDSITHSNTIVVPTSQMITIGQEFEFVFMDYVKQIVYDIGIIDTSNFDIKIDNLPSPIYSFLQSTYKLDTVGVGSFEIDRIEYVYNYTLTDFDVKLFNHPDNILGFTRSNISSSKIDSTRLYFLPNSPLTPQDFKNVKIDASNQNVQPLGIVNMSVGFNFEPVLEQGGYTNMLLLPVINPNAEYRQYMIPPNDSVTYTFKVVFKNPIKFALDDKLKLSFKNKLTFLY